MLGGKVSSLSAKTESAESDEEEIASKVPEKKLDGAIMKSSSSAQKESIKRLFATFFFGKAYANNARSKPIVFVPNEGDPVAYDSMSAMTRVTGFSKAKSIENTKCKTRGDIERSSSAMNKAGTKGIIASADDTMFTAM